MDRNDADSGAPIRDLAGSGNESIEDLLRKHGFFDTLEPDKVEQILPAPDDQVESLHLLWINAREVEPNPVRNLLARITAKLSQVEWPNKGQHGRNHKAA